MPMIQYFAYGSNMLTLRLQDRCPSATVREVAWAEDLSVNFFKTSTDGSGKATITSAAGHRAFGVIFDLDEGHLSALDRFEGAGKGYDRIDDFSVRIKGSDQPIRTVSYLASPTSIDRSLQPYDWYLALVIAGAREHALPAEYITHLEATAFKADAEPSRRSRLQALALLNRLSPSRP
jgi:hypothetical protein